MQKSETIGKLAEALSKAQANIKGAITDSANPYFKSKYADLSSVWDACRKPLTENGLSVIQTIEHDPAEPDMLIVETTLAHSSGEWISGRLVAKPVKSDPQSIGSCLTYMRRYSLSAVAGVSPEDDDANLASGKTGKKEHEPMTYSSVSQKEIVEPGASSQAAEGTQAIPAPAVEQSKQRKALEIKLKDSGWDRELFKEWLFTLNRLEKKDGKLSMKNLPDKTIKDLMGGYSWDWVIKHFNLWVDEKNKTTNDIQESLLEK